MTMKHSPLEQVTVSTWIGQPFMNSDTILVSNIPTCENPSCTLGIKDIWRTSNLAVAIYKSCRLFTVSLT